jgi:hypothetical protein
MRTVELKKKPIDVKKLVKFGAQEADYDTLLEGDVIGVDADTKEVIFVSAQLHFDDREVMQALENIKLHNNTRANGLKTTSRIFGYYPRRTFRKDYCSVASLAVHQPREHALICRYGAFIAELYAEHTPEAYAAHHKMMEEKVLTEWAIKDTPFTSGIINKNNPLKYHHDTGNFEGLYSCMVVFKRDVQGGHLALPEYGVGVALPHNSVFMFDGQSVLHGVTPITKLSDKAARYSIVYYSLKQIWQCLPLTEELNRIRVKKTDRERNRAKGVVHESLRPKS